MVHWFVFPIEKTSLLSNELQLPVYTMHMDDGISHSLYDFNRY
jgi:hypothetical protein